MGHQQGRLPVGQLRAVELHHKYSKWRSKLLRPQKQEAALRAGQLPVDHQQGRRPVGQLPVGQLPVGQLPVVAVAFDK